MCVRGGTAETRRVFLGNLLWEGESSIIRISNISVLVFSTIITPHVIYESPCSPPTSDPALPSLLPILAYLSRHQAHVQKLRQIGAGLRLSLASVILRYGIVLTQLPGAATASTQHPNSKKQPKY